jgi:ABC-type uncharacterized transport system permease subunit
MELFLAFIPVVFFSLLAWWKYNPVLFMVTAGVALLVGFNSPDFLSPETTTSLEVTIGLTFIAYALLCVGMAFQTIFGSRTEEE